MLRLVTFLFLVGITFPISAQIPHALILSEEERAKVVDDILEDRLDNLLPPTDAPRGNRYVDYHF